MADLFLSYAHADEARARQIVGALEGRGLSVWWDPHIQHGKDFRADILQQIRDASCVVVLWSHAALNSPFVIDEAAEAMEGGKLLPILLERGVLPPVGMRQLQAANLTDWDGRSAHEQLDRLIKSIKAFADRVGTGDARPGRTVDARPLAPSEIRARAHYLKDTRRHIENLLSASIHCARALDLGIADTPRATRLPWIYKNADVEQEFPNIAAAFEAFDRRMLLLGAPGAGKTVTLLHLALDLIAAAERNTAAPIPLVVNLSKFSLERSERSLLGGFLASRAEPVEKERAFEKWLAAELAERPGISRAAAAHWIEEDRIAALLDGLDEVNDERRVETAELLNTTYFREHPESVVVVCSRIADYQPLQDRVSARLHLTGAITLQPLGVEQIEAYLAAAQASGLRDALGQDDALFELARTPLTLSMLTLAYGGKRADDIPSFGRSDTRHRLMESFVARMLQRTERRARRIPFDDDKEREVPPKQYRFRPNRVNAYLGWLATRSSVRSQTSVPVRTLYSFVARPIGEEESPDVWTARSARAVFLAALLSALGVVMMPFDGGWRAMATLLAVTAGCVLAYCALFVLPVRGSKHATWAGRAVGAFLLFPGFAAVSRSVSTLLPLELRPLPVGLLAAAAAAALIGNLLEAGVGTRFKVIVPATAIGFAAGMVPVYFEWVDWSGGAPLAATTVGGLMIGLWTVVAKDSSAFVTKARMIAVSIAALAVVLLLQHSGLVLLGSFPWGLAFALIGSLLALMARGEKPSLVLLVFTSAAAAGHLLAGNEGSVFAVFLLCAIPFVWLLAGVEGSIRKTISAAVGKLGDRLETLIERVLLSPLAAKCLAARGRLPWRLRRFLRYCSDALLVKPFEGEIEFVHRRLRDYFALRELIPQLDQIDATARKRAIAALGFQGVSAVDTLGDLAQEADVGDRALAVNALGRIAVPEAMHFLERALADPSPEVRAAVVGSLRHAGSADLERLLTFAVGDEAPAVQHAVIDAVVDLYLDCDRLVVRMLQQRRFSVDLLRHVAARTGESGVGGSLAAEVGRALPDTAREQMEALLNDSDAGVRQQACEWSAEHTALGDAGLLVHLLRADPVAAVRAAAASALAQIQDASAVPRLVEALADDVEQVRLSAARAVARFKDERVADALIGLLQDPSAVVREAAADLVGERADPGAVEPLIRALGDPVAAVRCNAAGALRRLGDRRAIEPLVTCLADPDDKFWEWAANALIGLDPDRAADALGPFLGDRSPMKRRTAARARPAPVDDA